MVFLPLNIWKDHTEVSLQPSLQLFFIRQLFQYLNWFFVAIPWRAYSNRSMSFFIGKPRTGQSPPGRVSQEPSTGENHFPSPAGCTSFDAAKDTIGFLGSKHTLLSHVQVVNHQCHQVLLQRAGLNSFIAQPVLILGIALTQAQDLALCLAEPYEPP